MIAKRTFLRSEEGDGGEGGGGPQYDEVSFMDKLNDPEFLIKTKSPSEEKEKEKDSDTKNKNDEADRKEKEKDKEKDQKDKDGEEKEKDKKDDSEFPDLAKKKEKAKDGSFNETDFDAQTEKILKQLEEKGHPGDVYKQLRAELKEARKSSSNVDLEKIPEYLAIKEKAEKSDALASEIEALKQKNSELLSLGDEATARQLPEYIDRVQKPREQMEEFLGNLAALNEMDKQIFLDIIFEENLKVQDAALDKLAKDIGPRNAGRVERLIDDYRKTVEVEKQIMSNAKQSIEKSRADRAKQLADQERVKVLAYKSELKSSFDKYAQRIPGFTDSVGSLTETGKAALASAETVDISDLDSSDIAFMAFAAKSLTPLRNRLAELEKENAILKSGKGSSKTFGDGSSSENNDSDDYDPDDGMSMSEALAKRLKR